MKYRLTQAAAKDIREIAVHIRASQRSPQNVAYDARPVSSNAPNRVSVRMDYDLPVTAHTGFYHDSYIVALACHCRRSTLPDRRGQLQSAMFMTLARLNVEPSSCRPRSPRREREEGLRQVKLARGGCNVS